MFSTLISHIKPRLSLLFFEFNNYVITCHFRMSADPVSTTEVELTIRCALQTFEDKALKVPIDWKVQELKSHLYEACPTKPVSRLFIVPSCLSLAYQLSQDRIFVLYAVSTIIDLSYIAFIPKYFRILNDKDSSTPDIVCRTTKLCVKS